MGPGHIEAAAGISSSHQLLRSPSTLRSLFVLKLSQYHDPVSGAPLVAAVRPRGAGSGNNRWDFSETRTIVDCNRYNCYNCDQAENIKPRSVLTRARVESLLEPM